MHLTEEQSNYLRILGHTLTPAVDIGAGGLTNSLMKELDKALTDHELVKVRVRFGDRERRSKVFEKLAPLADACLVKEAGYVALLYRPSNPSTIRLP
jgi:RNA-binding protein